MFFEQLYMLKIEDFLKFPKSYICCAYITFSNFNNLNIYNFGVIYVGKTLKITLGRESRPPKITLEKAL